MKANFIRIFSRHKNSMKNKNKKKIKNTMAWIVLRNFSTFFSFFLSLSLFTFLFLFFFFFFTSFSFSFSLDFLAANSSSLSLLTFAPWSPIFPDSLIFFLSTKHLEMSILQKKKKPNCLVLLLSFVWPSRINLFCLNSTKINLIQIQI